MTHEHEHLESEEEHSHFDFFAHELTSDLLTELLEAQRAALMAGIKHLNENLLTMTHDLTRVTEAISLRADELRRLVD